MILLDSERLFFRNFVPEDLDPLFSLYSDPDVRRYIPEGVLTREETEAELNWYLHGHPTNPRLGLWATVLKDGDQFIGRCGLIPWTIDGVAEIELAYMIAKNYWGRGYGTEAARAILRYSLEELRLPRLISLIDSQNHQSIRVALNIGMTYEKDGEDELGLFSLYSIHDR